MKDINVALTVLYVSLLEVHVILLVKLYCGSDILKAFMFHIMKTCLCNEYTLTSHFYIVKLGFTGVYFFSYFCSKT